MSNTHVEAPITIPWTPHDYQPLPRPSNMNELTKLIINSPGLTSLPSMPTIGNLNNSPTSAFSQPPQNSAFSPPSPSLLLAALAQQHSLANSTPNLPTQNPNFPLDLARFQQQFQLQQAQQAILQQIISNQLNSVNNNGSRSAPATTTTFPTQFPSMNPAILHAQQTKAQGFPFTNLNPLLGLKPPLLSNLNNMPPPKMIPPRTVLRKNLSVGQIDCQSTMPKDQPRSPFIQNLQTMKTLINQTTLNDHVDFPGTSTAQTTLINNKPKSTSDSGRSDVRSRSSSGSSHESFEMGRLPTTNYYPTHFMKGTIIELADGRTKKVEDMSSDDFLKFAEISSYLTMETSVVEGIEQIGQLIRVHFLIGDDKAECTQEYQPEHPFFVVAHGWSSHDPRKTKNTYGLDARQLMVGDMCISLTQRPDDVNGRVLEETVSISDARRFADRDAIERNSRDRKRRHSLSDQSSTTDSGNNDVVSGGSSSSGSSPLLHKKDEETENEQNEEQRDCGHGSSVEKKICHNSEEINVSA